MISPDILAGLLNPITLLVLGVPIWVYTWMIIQKSITNGGRAELSLAGWRVIFSGPRRSNQHGSGSNYHPRLDLALGLW